MRQWHEHKQQVGDAILLFRMGDFYELFYDDAVLAARVLGITLTSRDGAKTPLAGIPYHQLETYLARLVAQGYKVAISEQIEDARLAKGVVKRAIARIVTPGTLTDESLLPNTQANLLAAVCPAAGQAGVAALELSTGQFTVQLVAEAGLFDELARLAPAEVLLPEHPSAGSAPLEPELRQRIGAALTRRSSIDFAPHRAEEVLLEQFQTAGLEGFGFERMDASLQAAGALLQYVHETQKCATQHVQPPRRRVLSEFMQLDPVTLRSLEIERTLRTGTREGSLLAAVDQTANPMGARLLRQWLCYPLRRVADIRRRQRIVAALAGDDGRRLRIRQALRDIGDIARTVGRVGVQRTTPRELRALGDGLARLGPLRAELVQLAQPETDELVAPLEGLDGLSERLRTVLAPDAPPALRDGGIFAAGFHAELDRLRLVGSDGQRWLAEYQLREAQRSGIPSLKVAYNKVFGFYIEITNPHRDRVPPEYVRKQTVKNAERYITDELKRYEADFLTAEARARELEYELFCGLRDEVAAQIPALQRVATVLAELDVLAGWAELARKRHYCRPEFVDQPVLEIEAGRHPVVEQLVEGGFVANDTALAARDPASGIGDQDSPRASHETFEPMPDDGDLSDAANTPDARERASSAGVAPAVRSALGAPRSLAVITGPNMAGKSTYIRQVALLTLLAHCGCGVPARRMRLGVADRIFTRVGAADELARGQSTFMVEMVETANIIHNATPRSLVILDEVGRGTSTFDGLALAWAITEYLATRVGCRTLFATHYHELTELAELLDGIVNLNVAVREHEDQVVFLHRIVPGAADRSYGLHVAKLAGLPAAVLERANAVLNELEKSFVRESQRPVLAAVQRRRTRQLRLFEEPEEAVVRQLRELRAEGLDAGRALELVRAWRAQLGG
jgi:DNA mismatch repair protein MutS